VQSGPAPPRGAGQRPARRATRVQSLAAAAGAAPAGGRPASV